MNDKSSNKNNNPKRNKGNFNSKKLMSEIKQLKEELEIKDEEKQELAYELSLKDKEIDDLKMIWSLKGLNWMNC